MSFTFFELVFDDHEYCICNDFFSIGRKGAIEATSAALEVLGDPLKSLSLAVLSMCAYAGTGDVLVIQEMLHICSEHYDTDVSKSEISIYIVVAYQI